MKLVNLHQNGLEMLVNLSTVSEVYLDQGSGGSTLYFNFEVDGEQVRIKVDESLNEIYEKMKGNG